MKTSDFFTLALEALRESAPNQKCALVGKLYSNLKQGALTFDHSSPVLEIERPSYAGFATVVKPSEVPSRKRFDTKEGQAVLLHAIAHIEYSAIDLALDSAYRFRGMPTDYYIDWIEVADDEVRHFGMLEVLMENIGVKYGEFPVHTLLFDAGRRSGGDLLERMAVVPRYLEAGGLDANPKIVKKLQSYPKTGQIEAMIEFLETILREEVDHVGKGDKWFKFEAARRGVDESVYFEIIERFYPGFEKRGAQMNVHARLKAGFSCSELKRMGAEKCN
ncbi:uncharacterized protein NNO_0878 [Hydrogenimonas sp.]|nr:uncharacterized protein NNO_0878 [Hydrogenimonas sp.]